MPHTLHKHLLILFFFASTIISVQKIYGEAENCERIPLAGIWHFKSDLQGIGIQSNGLQMFPPFPENITLPGSTDEAGKGILTQGMTSLRLTKLYEYKGAAWYEKNIFIPEHWKNKEIKLFLERAHWETKLWVNNQYAGTEQSLSTPHLYAISNLIQPGKINNIRLRVDNSLIYNIEYSHAISAETQTNWNGIIGKIELQAFDNVFLEDIQVYPDLPGKKVRVDVIISNKNKRSLSGKLKLDCTASDLKIKVPTLIFPFSGRDSLIKLRVDLPLGEKIMTWDEFTPSLYQLKVAMSANSDMLEASDCQEIQFGMRQVKVDGTRFTINGRVSFIRGTVNSAEFPLTGYPYMDEKNWERIMRTCKSYGLNCIRFHSWCPPQAAFNVADRLGLYLQIENSDWRFLVGKSPEINEFLKKETDRIFREFGNHPSFIFFCEGNELAGPKVSEFLSEMVQYWKRDPRHLYTGSAAYPLIPENQYNVLYGARPHRWKEGLKSRFNAAPLNTLYDYSDYVKKYPVPMITHEIGQWCVYPNYDEIPKYTGVLKPYNYQIFRESLRDHHMLDMAQRFTEASGRFQLLLKKEEFESYLRTPGMAGYHLLQLNDFPGQGTSPVGVVDVFWDPKPYVTADEFRQMQAPCLPLLRTASFVWTNNDEFAGTAQFANYGTAELKRVVLRWTLLFPDGKIYLQGNLPAKNIPLGSPYTFGEIKISLHGIQKAAQMKLQMEVPGTTYRNHWDIWVYPTILPPESLDPNVRIEHQWTREVKEYLNNGGKVILLPDTAEVRSTVSSCFTGISWNAVWSGMPPETLGILCNPKHPMFSNFPTDSYSNWQWWDLVIPAKLMNLDHTPSAFRPLVQMIPDWNKNNKLGLVIEANIGKGKLLLCTIDLINNMEKRPVARQLLYSIKKYVNSSNFIPEETLSFDMIDVLFK